MEDKIEVGEFVRNESGYIHKVDSFDKLTNFFKDEDGKLKEWVGEDIWGNTVAEIIVKHSKNKMNLIDIDDYVNGLIVIGKYFDKDNKICLILDTTDIMRRRCYEENIKSIVTKEQFAQVQYKVGEQ